MAKDELAGLDGRALTGQGFDPAACHDRIADHVLAPEGVAAVRLGSEVITSQHAHAVKALQLLLCGGQCAFLLLAGRREDRDGCVDVLLTEDALPLVGGIGPHVDQLLGTPGHAGAGTVREAVQRIPGHPPTSAGRRG